MKAVTYVEIDVPEFGSVDEQLDSSLNYNFTSNSVLSWSGSAATVTANIAGMIVAATGQDPIIRSPAGLTIDGSTNRYVRIDIRRTAVRTLGVWQGNLFWTTAGHGETGSFVASIPELANTLNARAEIILDMWNATAGGSDWQTSIITRLRLDFEDGQSGGVTPNGAFRIESIAVGNLDTERGAFFDGTNDYLNRGGVLTDVADSKQFTFSGWIRPQVVGGRIIHTATTIGGADTTTSRLVLGGGTFAFNPVLTNAAGSTIFNASSSPLVQDEWSHVLASVDLADPSSLRIYVNGVSDIAAASVFTNDTIDWTMADWSIGSRCDGSAKFTGYLADIWFAPGVYIDFDIDSTRALFRTARGGPRDLGVGGENPTGARPMIFMSGPSSFWPQNKGRGGGFIEHGDLTAAFQISETRRFAIPVDYLDQSIDAIPSITGLAFNPATVSLGENLGMRANVSVTFRDHPHQFLDEGRDVGTFWGKWRGRYMTKLRNCPLRIIRGLEGQELAGMDVRHYLIDTTNGPLPRSGAYNITAKDILKLADDDRSQAPVLSNGSLSGSINNSILAATLTPSGIGNLEYPASGWICLGGKEIVSFTRIADALTIVRGQLGSTAIAHDAGDRAQLVLRYAGDDVADIIYDLLVNYTEGVTDAMIPLTEWIAETAAYLGTIYTATLTEPTGVKKLLSELVHQAALALWWDDRAQLIQLKVLKEIATDAELFDEEIIVEDSLNVAEQADKRISQFWTFYGQRDPTDQADNNDNYRAALASVDLELESEYGSPAITKTPARWIGTLTAAQRLNGIQLSRFRDPPRNFKFTLFRDQNPLLGNGYRLAWAENQDASGIVQSAPIQITKIRVEPDYIYVEAEEMLASGVIVLTNTVFLLTTGSVLNWTVPATWNDADNSINTIGGAGGGAWRSSSGSKGGGGGAYSGIVNLNLTPGASVSYRVGTGGVGGVSGSAPGGDGSDTWFNGANLAASSVGAKAGLGGINQSTAGTGGLAASGIGTVKTSGGNAGNGSFGSSNGGGGGGGGAGGPNGDGNIGGNGAGNFGTGGGGADGGSAGLNTGTPSGGNNRFSFGGGAATGDSGTEGGAGAGGGIAQNGGPGGDGEQMWTQTIAPILAAGPGGAGGGGGFNASGGAGGDFGGGGGGAGENGPAGGDGAQGVIVITWKDA